MKLRLLALSALVLANAAGLHAENYSSRESFDRSSAFQATGEIALENINGDIEIATWDKNEIRIEGEKSAKTEEELKLIDLSIEVSESRATIIVRQPRRPGAFLSNNRIRAAVKFKLTVPTSAVLAKVATTNSNIRIEGVRGPVNASTVNGSIRARGLASSAHFETVNGSIESEFRQVGADQKISGEAVNGRVVIRLPKDAGFAFHGSTVNGSVQCDFPLERSGGKSRKSVSGTMGDGRAKVEAETVNGSVHLASL